jgi:large subunit ribosomal protein L24
MPSKPRTQRRALYTKPLHLKHSLVHVHLGKELRSKLKTGARSVPVKKGDRVRVMRGSHKKKTGKVTKVDLKRAVVFVEGIIVRKAKGGEVPVALQPSNLLLLEGNFDDKGRKKVLSRKKGRS